MNLNFTTTACNRPELLRKTYGFFSEKLKGVDFGDQTLYINVDPMPDGKGRERVVDVAEQFFGEVNYRFPDEASFPKAVEWIWSQVESEYFFNLEDDWKIHQVVRVPKLVKFLRNNNGLQVILRHSANHGPNSNNPTFERLNVPGLPPNVTYRPAVDDLIENFDTNSNPEKGFRYWYKDVDIPQEPYMYPSNKITSDIGREWRHERNLWKRRIDGRAPGQWDTWVKDPDREHD